jgi:hypothetical protein
MNKNMELLGKVIAVVGVLACLVAGVARLFGTYSLGPVESMTVFNVGVGLMVTALVIKQYA